MIPYKENLSGSKKLSSEIFPKAELIETKLAVAVAKRSFS